MIRMNSVSEITGRIKDGIMAQVTREPNIEVKQVYAFTYKGAGGNPAGVVFDADKYSAKQKQEIARLAGNPETAFVSKSSIADVKLEFFTPNKQIAHCGHATVATFSYLNQKGIITKRNASKETVDGPRDIILEDGMAFMEQRPQFYKELADDIVDKVMKSLSLTTDDLKAGYRPMISNTGVSFLIIPLKDNQALKTIKTNLNEINKISEDFDLIGFYAFTTEPIEEDHDITTRMFAPRYAINEEAATGMAAGTLSAYLFDHMNFKKETIMIEQGYFMHPVSKSEITVRLTVENGKLVKLMAGGFANVGNSQFVNIGI